MSLSNNELKLKCALTYTISASSIPWRPKDGSGDFSLMLDPGFPSNDEITEHAQMMRPYLETTVALLTSP